jgi:hypothetical protein
VPETIVSGETADISTFTQHHWYEWIMFRDTSVSFPGDKLVLGRYLGPSIDVGPAMTAKILKANGVIVHRSSYWSLTDIEQVCEEHNNSIWILMLKSRTNLVRGAPLLIR